MPAEFIIMSLPPWLRYKAENMLISMFIPSTLSAASQSKYFKSVIDSEFNPLFEKGLAGAKGPVKVKIFGHVCV